MTYTIWSNGGRFEYIVYENDAIKSRSGLVFTSRAVCRRAMNAYVASVLAIAS